MPGAPDLTGRPRVPGAILLAGHVTGALPLRLAGGRPEGTAPLLAAAPLGLGLAVAVRPWRMPPGSGLWPAAGRPAPGFPADPLQGRLARGLVAALHGGPLLPPLVLARDAALELGAWPRAAAMALGGLRWAGPPPGWEARGPVSAPEDTGEGDPCAGDGGWPTPAAAARAAAFAALPPDWLTPLARGLLLVASGDAAARGAWPPPPEWEWAARWNRGSDGALARALDREARWLARWRQRLPVDLAVDPRPRRRPAAGEGRVTGDGSAAGDGRDEANPAGTPGATAGNVVARAAPGGAGPGGGPEAATSGGDADRSLAALLREAAAGSRFVREEGLVPAEVAGAWIQLETHLRGLGWDPEGAGAPPLWPAWHVAWPVWALWLEPAGAGDGAGTRRVAAELVRRGWRVARLHPVVVGAHLRLDVPGPQPRPAAGDDPPPG